MNLTTLDGQPATMADFAELAKAWYEKHGEDGMSGWPPAHGPGRPPISYRCERGDHNDCKGQRIDGHGYMRPCECSHHLS